MSRAQQSSIRSFFTPRRQPEYAAPPSSAPPSANSVANGTASPPPAPPLPESQKSTVADTARGSLSLPLNGIPTLPSPPSLPSGAIIVPLEAQHIPALRRINSLLLPVPYPDSFYAKALEPLESGLFSRAILWQDSEADTPKVIGGLVCRLEPNYFVDDGGQLVPEPSQVPSTKRQPDAPGSTPYQAIYIQSLALFSPYRSLGLAAAALDHIIASAAVLPAAGSNIDVRTIYAHVWTDNEDGLRWYESRGFTRASSEPVRGYYFKLRPDTAWVVRRQIGASAGSSGSSGCGDVLGALPRASGIAATTAAAGKSSMHPTTEPHTSPTGKAGTVLAAAVNLPSITAAESRAPVPPPPKAAPASRSATPAAAPPSAVSSPPAGGAKPPGSAGPPRRPPAAPIPSSSSTLSFQNARPETEWNDLPLEMVAATTPVPARSVSSQSLPLPPAAAAAAAQNQQQQQQLLTPSGSGTVTPTSRASSSRSSSTAGRKKRERAYPSAAFGPP